MTRIVTGQAIPQKTDNLRGTAIEDRYYSWLHETECCVTGNPYGIEIAHTGGLPEGKGMSRKSNLDTCLPLVKSLHVIEERNRDYFWKSIGLSDHLVFAARLFEAFENGESAHTVLIDMQDKVNRAAVRLLLSNAA